MVSQVFYLRGWDWTVKVFYETEPENADRVLDTLGRNGCSEDVLTSARDIFYRGMKNTGFTYSNSEKRCSVMAISRTTSADEFANTFDHEKRHLSMHIADAYHIDIHGEEYAYLAGAIAQHMFRVARRFMCDCCRKKR